MSTTDDLAVVALVRVASDRSFALHFGPTAASFRTAETLADATARVSAVVSIARSLAGGHRHHLPPADMASMLVALGDALAAADDAEWARP